MGDAHTGAGVTAMRKLRLGDTEVTRIGLGTNRLTRENVGFVKDGKIVRVQTFTSPDDALDAVGLSE